MFYAVRADAGEIMTLSGTTGAAFIGFGRFLWTKDDTVLE